MNFSRILVPIAGAALVAFAWRSYGWAGVALAVGGIVMWMLLHFTRLTQVLKRASKRPIGYVDSAVMLNARLKPGLTLLHVIGLTRALGEQLSDKDAQPEIYRWTDGSASHVTCEFAAGRLAKWDLHRPTEAPAQAPAEPPAA
ncbi:glycerate kinase [Ramlibacter algicola]|uniref:Glycerate kinase n=1 Tax=Ramlibacter algicola TaxID=2795217 RepID=A0A934PVX3_9BURK|nr:glycerate kinase [Ramlibacter algicola]MBK0391459.1 glycerate kinase [Ramlibacter algicola]